MAVTITVNPSTAATNATTPVVVTGAGGPTWLSTPPTFTISGTGNSTGAVTVTSNTVATVQVTLAGTTGAFTLTDTLDVGSPTATITGVVVAKPVVIPVMPQFASVSVNAANLNDLVQGVPGYFIVVDSYTLVPPNATAVTVTWESHTAGAISGAMPVGGTGNQPYLTASSGTGLFQTAAGESLAINLSGASLVVGHLTYHLQRSA